MKATIQQHRGDLDAAETACADMEIGLDELTPTPSSTPTSSRKRPQDPDSALLESLQKRVGESGTILKDLSKAQQQPITARTAFANYVKDSLLTMSKAKYKKARSTINRLLSDLMDEDSHDDIASAMGAPPIPATQQASHSQPPRPSSTPSFGSFGSSAPSTSEQYQPPPHMWRNVPPASSVWGSQSMEYREQYHQPHPQQPAQQTQQQQHQRTTFTGSIFCWIVWTSVAFSLLISFRISSFSDFSWLIEWGFYALSASKAIFRARTYNCNLFSPVMMIT